MSIPRVEIREYKKRTGYSHKALFHTNDGIRSVVHYTINHDEGKYDIYTTGDKLYGLIGIRLLLEQRNPRLSLNTIENSDTLGRNVY